MFQHLARLAVMAACLLAAVAAGAQSPDNPWYLSGLASYVDDDVERHADDGLTGGQLALGIPFGARWSLELFALYNEFNADGFNADQEQKGLGVGAIRWFNPGGRWSPYLGVAGGYSDTSRVSGQDESAPMASGALGLLIHFGDSRFSLRTEARYRQVLEDITLSDLYLSSGLQWALGRGGAGRKASASADEDGDGVRDAIDRCLGSAAGAIVGADGCSETDDDLDGVPNRLDRCPRTPRNVAVNSRGCPPDSDRDGVIDALDACRGTPWGVGVDKRGCPLTRDADGDGVEDNADRCPETAKGVATDQTGCPLPARIQLPGVAFRNNSSQLLPVSTRTLDQAAEILLANPGLRAEVAGHTDSVGEAGYNLWLSQRRADAVRGYLVARGVAAERLSARGYGESEPLADNSNAAGRARNRRVELRTDAQ